MNVAPLIVVVTGSECTGKTMLAADLAGHFEAPASAEYVREYLEHKGVPLDADDVTPIARGQIRAEDDAISPASRLVIKDTDLMSTVVYSRYYYGDCPPWIVEAARQRRAGLYLLLHPDVPWLPDGLQRDRPDDRDGVHALFRQQLEASGASIVDIVGSWEARRATAIAAVAHAMAVHRRRSALR